MKLITKAFAVLLALLIVISAVTAASAATVGSALSFTAAENTTTRITYTDGSVKSFSGTLDPESIEPSGIAERIGSYELFYDGDSVLKVTLNDVYSQDDSVSANSIQPMNGYYAAEFEITGKNKEAFITGLNPSNLGKLQRELVNSYVFDEELRIEDLDFIDAEKTTINESDNNLCWAGTCSNMIAYSGWGQYAGFGDTDDVFDSFVDSFYDGGAFIPYGIKWFFNGVAKVLNDSTAQIKDYGNSGNYIPEVCAENVTRVYNGEPIAMINGLISSLKDGCAVGLGVQFGYLNDEVDNAHAITCWGYILNNEYPEDDLRHYDALIISDSDNDKMDGYENRRMAPNTLNVLSMTPYENENMNYKGFMFHTYTDAVLYDVNVLYPYEEGKYIEPYDDATLDLLNYPDFTSGSGYVSTNAALYTEDKMVPAGSDVFVFPHIKNLSDYDFSGDVKISVTVSDSDGNEVSTGEWTEYAEVRNNDEYLCTGSMRVEAPAAGTYTAEVTVNPDHSTPEAYFSNNTGSFTFEVKDAGFDITEWKIEAEIGSVLSSEITADMSYDIPQDVLDSAESCTVSMQLFNTQTQSWSVEGYVGCLEDGQLPEQATIFKYGNPKVRFLLSLYSPDYGWALICSDEYSIAYDYLEVNKTEICTDEFTPIDYGQRNLAEGEKFAFTITNPSADKAFTGTVTVDSGSENSPDLLEFTQFDITLAPGETSPEYTLDSWDFDISRPGSYAIKASAEGSFEDGNEVYCSLSLGRLKVKEKPSTVVNNKEAAVNPYDNRTSLIEAMQYCPDGGTITFDPSVKQVLYKKNNVKDDAVTVFDVDRDITIDGAYKSVNGMTCGVQFGNYYFDVKAGAKLTLRGIYATNIQMITTDSFIKNKGELVLEDCRIRSLHCRFYGAIHTDGGTVKIKNTTFEECEALYGSAIAIDGGAKVDMLNCTVQYCNSRTGSVHNIYGELNIVNSEITLSDVYTNFEDNGSSLTGNRVTRVVNSLLFTRVGNEYMQTHADASVAGDVELFGCAFDNIKGEVNADENCIAPGSLNDIINLDKRIIDAQGFYEDEFSVYCMVNVKPEYREKGFIVSVEDGKLVYSDGENTYQTGITAAFDEEDYACDILGTQRGRAFGCCCDLNKVGVVRTVGDVNLDGIVDVMDAAMVQKATVDKIELNEDQQYCADVNFDGAIDVLDSTIILKYTVGKVFYIG